MGTETSYPFWEEYRQRLMIQMHRLLKCPIEKMWPAATNFFRYQYKSISVSSVFLEELLQYRIAIQGRDFGCVHGDTESSGEAHA